MGPKKNPFLCFSSGLSSFLGYTNQYYEDSLSSKNVAVVGLLLKARKKILLKLFFPPSFDELTHGQGRISLA